MPPFRHESSIAAGINRYLRSNSQKIILRIITLVVLITFSLSVITFTSKSTSTRRRTLPPLPEGYEFIPSHNLRPIKRNAVLTLLAGAPNPQQPALILDDFCLLAHYQAYSFLHGKVTPLDPNSDIEFVVMVTHGTPQHCIEGLLSLGARIIKVPILQVDESQMTHRYGYTFSKFQMWALEGFYDTIVTHDGDLFFLNRSPLDLFDVVRKYRKSGAVLPFYGGCRDWPGGPDFETGQFDSAIIALEPTMKDYRGLLETVPKALGFGDQRVLTTYYNSKGPRPYTILPQRYLTARLLDRTKEEIDAAVGFHWKFMTNKLTTPATAGLFEKWARQMQDLRRIQVEKLVNGGKVLPVVPVVPESFDEWEKLRSYGEAVYDTVAILSFGVGPNTATERSDVAKLYSQAVHFVNSETSISMAKILVEVEKALKRFEWVWLPHRTVVMDTTKPILFTQIIGEFKKTGGNKLALVGYTDCQDTQSGASRSGSVFINRSTRTHLKDYISNLDPLLSDVEIWEGFAARFDSVQRQLHGKSSFYSVKTSDCKSLYLL